MISQERLLVLQLLGFDVCTCRIRNKTASLRVEMLDNCSRVSSVPAKISRFPGLPAPFRHPRGFPNLCLLRIPLIVFDIFTRSCLGSRSLLALARSPCRISPLLTSGFSQHFLDSRRSLKKLKGTNFANLHENGIFNHFRGI